VWGSMSDKYIKLSDLAQVPGIGKKTLERIQNTVKIYTFDEQTSEEKINLTNWLDEIFEGL
jgi:DNA-binding Xre family transcriptional regulator